MVSHVVLCVLGCTRATLIHSTVLTNSLSDMNNVSLYVSVWKLSFCCADLWLLLWKRQGRERFHVSSATRVIKISRVHSPVVKAADCRSAGPWFNSGRRTWFTFVTWYDKLTNHNFLMINIMSPITTSNRTITRKSVNMVAEMSNDTAPARIPDTTYRLDDYSAMIALKTPSRFGANALVDWMQWSGVPILAGGPAADRMPGRLIGESLDRLGNPTFRMGLQNQEQSQEQHIRLDEDQLTTDTTDLKITEAALMEDTAAFEDTTQDCLAIQA